MQDRIYNVLFLCTGNSARSILAEGLMNHLGQGRFRAGRKPSAGPRESAGDTALILRRRIELLISLPLAKLDRLAIQREVKNIGRRS